MNFKRIFSSFFKNINRICFPSSCLNCGAYVETEGICSDCWSKINWFSEPRCSICGQAFEIDLYGICAKCVKNPPYFDKALSVFLYDDATKKMIIDFKHRDSTSFARIFAYWMFRVAEYYLKDADLLIPVPIHISKRIARKYNQSELLAQKLSKLSGTAYEPRVLEKTRQTKAQEGLSAKERRQNLRNSFAISKKYRHLIKNKDIILVDDVFTTGSTVNECAKMLKLAGAGKITVLTLARR